MGKNKKVELPKEVARAIWELREIGLSDYAIVNNVGRRQGLGSTGLTPRLRIIEKEMVDKARGNDLLDALVNGFVCEETPEEKLRRYYEMNNLTCDNVLYEDLERLGVRKGVRDTLKILGITVEGIYSE